ncbi:MAG: pilus assembly protein PilM [Candidatus Omnitrophica bacterium]|nr:pilus assembly protein PilM [Candidatus Omnitrophota bacterium]
MFGADQRILSFSLNETIIKLAQVSSGGLVEKIAWALAAEASPEVLGQTLKILLNGFDHKAMVVCVIPASAVTSKTIEVPSLDPQEIKSILNLQVNRHTPYSRQEVLVGSINLGLASAHQTKVLLVIAHRHVIKDRLTVLEKVSLNPDKILFVPEGIGRLYAGGLNLKKDSLPVGIIDVALTSVNFIVVCRGSVVFCRSIPIGIKQMIESQEAVLKLLEEINKSIAASSGEDAQAAVASFVVTSDHEVVRNMLPLLQESLKAEVRLSPYVNLIQAGSVKSKLQQDFADDSFLDVIAPALTLAKCEVNLMPEEMVLKKTIEKQSQEATKAGIAAVLMMVLLGSIIFGRIYFKDIFLNKNLREQFAGQAQEVQKLQESLNKTKIVRQYLQSRMISLDIIHELYRITPVQIYLNTVALEEDGTLTVSGISDSMSQVFSYVKALSDSSLFKNVKTKSTTTKKDNGQDVAAFELSLKVEESLKE